jgi:Domain of unknown function (DUF4116)
MIAISDPNVVQTEELCMEAVKQNGYALEYVRRQTVDICIEAVKQNGLALQYVKNRTRTICIEAVKQNGGALLFVKNRTEAICIEAVKQDGCALEYVKKQTDAICMEAVRENGCALKIVINQTDAICLEAIDNYSKRDIWYTFKGVYHTIKYPSPQLIIQLIKIYPSYTNDIMHRYARNIIKTYKAGSDTLCAHLVPHANDLLYRPNNVNALISHERWHAEQINAKTIFLTA